jgi:hypothetical protein
MGSPPRQVFLNVPEFAFIALPVEKRLAVECDLDNAHGFSFRSPLRRWAMGAVLYCRIELSGTATP